MSLPSIGIMGGMGPRATIEFESRLISRFSGHDQAIPRIISVNNSQIPDRSSFLIEGATDPGQELIYSAEILRSAKVDIVCMPCNTAHNPAILAKLMASCPLPVLDMPGATMLLTERLGVKKVLVLGTTGTAQSKIFDSRSVVVKCSYPDDAGQRTVMDIIQTIKAGQTLTKEQINELNKLITDSGTEAVILACTELSLIPKDQIKASKIIDTLDALVDQCVNICNQQTKREVNQ